MLYEVVGNTLLCIHGPLDVNDEEWVAYCRDSATLSYVGTFAVVDRSGIGPNSRQRAEHSVALAKRTSPPRIAVVTDSKAHRGIVTVMNWMQRGTLKAFSPAQLREALNYAGVAPTARGQILRRVHELAIGVSSPWIAQTIPLDIDAAVEAHL
jgi:hypothetical protein